MSQQQNDNNTQPRKRGKTKLVWIITAVLLAVVLVVLVLLLTCCHKHKFADTYVSNETEHWRKATCAHTTLTTDRGEHVYGEWQITRPADEYQPGEQQRVCSVCGYIQRQLIERYQHTHTFEQTYTYDAASHWHASTCGHNVVDGKQPHTYNSTSGDTYTCTVCGYTHTHTYSADWTIDQTSHWHTATCEHGEVKSDLAPHTFGSDGVCTSCGYGRGAAPHVHLFEKSYTTDPDYHWHAAACEHDVIDGKQAHIFGDWSVIRPATETAEGLQERSCSVCGYTERQTLEQTDHVHVYSDAWSYNDDSHWHASKCDHPDARSDESAHTYGENSLQCTVCGYEQYYTHGLNYEYNADKTGFKVVGLGAATDLDIVVPQYYMGLPVTEIGDFGFLPIYSEDQLEDWMETWGDTIEELDDWADLDQLRALSPIDITSVTLPATIERIGAFAFTFATELKSVTLPQNNALKSIGLGAFGYCLDLSSFDFAAATQLQTIEMDAFAYAISLARANMPDSLELIDEQAFAYCRSLAAVTFEPDSKLDTIDREAFCWCPELKSFTIPASVTSIDARTFNYSEGDMDTIFVTQLNELTVAPGNAVYRSQGNCVISLDDGTLVVGCDASVIPDDGSVTVIGEHAFSGCGFTEIDIPASIEQIKSSAFQECLNLQTVNFAGDSNLTEIGDYAFHYCLNFASIVIPDSVQYIRYYAFADCPQLQTVTFGKDSKLTEIEHNAFSYDSSIVSIVIPDSVQYIRSDAFYNCSQLQTVTFGEDSELVEIEYDAFYHCPLTELTIYSLQVKPSSFSDSITHITFGENCTFTDLDLSVFPVTLQSITVPASVTYLDGFYSDDHSAFTEITFAPGSRLERIDQNVFTNTGVTEITIPASVTYIANDNFGENSPVQKVTFECASSSLDTSSMFCNNAALTEVDFGVGSAFTELGRTFYGCTSLRQVDNLPAELEQIGWETFYGCASLTTIKLPDNLRYIGPSAFAASGLTEIELPASLTQLDSNIFENCTSLKTVKLQNGWTNLKNSVYWYDNIFSGCSALCELYIPESIATYDDVPTNLRIDNDNAITVHYGGTQETWDSIKNYFTDEKIRNAATVVCAQ